MVGMRSCDLKPPTGIRPSRRNRGGVAVAGIVHDLDIEAAALVILARETARRVPRRWYPRDPLSGVTVTTGPEQLHDNYAPARPLGIGYPNLARSALCSGCLSQGQVHGSGPVAAVVHPLRRSPSLMRLPVNRPCRQCLFRDQPPGYSESSSLAMMAAGAEPGPYQADRAGWPVRFPG